MLFWRGQSMHNCVVATIVAALLILGGGSTDASLAYAIEFALGIGLLAFQLGVSGDAVVRRTPIVIQVLIFALFAVPLLQLLPLPPGWGQDAPGRLIAVTVRTLAGANATWLPLTLAPTTTGQVLFSLVILLAIFRAILLADTLGLQLIIGAVLAVEALTVATGVFQITSGGRLFNFYDSAHHLNLLGFFANRNHAAVFLACAIPFAAAVLASRRPQPRALSALVGLIGIAITIAVFGTVSRAGLVLTVVSLLLTLVLIAPPPAGRIRSAVMAAAIGAVLLGALVTSNAVSSVFARYADIGDDLRWQFDARTWALIPHFLPWGGGLGSFVPIYTANEALRDVRTVFVNNAHNDWLELLLEAGVAGLLLEVTAVAVVAWCGWRVVRMRSSPDRSLAIAGWIVAVLFLVHSAVDYPLRRMACAVTMTIALGLLVRPLLRPVGTRIARP